MHLNLDFVLTVQPQTPTGLNMQNLWLFMVGLCSLFVGIFGGVMGYRWYHERKSSKCKGNSKVSSQGIENLISFSK